MSIVVLNAEPELGRVLLSRLFDEGDEVRIVEQDAMIAQEWKELGAHVARGPCDDEDLLMRAATGARTFVVLDRDPRLTGRATVAAIEAARLSSVDRIILAAPKPSPGLIDLVVASGLDHVVLSTQAAGLGALLRRSLPPRGVAAAIDAADDLAGNPHLVLDLGDERAWNALGLQPPET